MASGEDILTAQVGSMLEMLEDTRERRCREIADAAEAERARTLAQARREARERIAGAVRSRRRSNEQRIRYARAQLETMERTRQLERARVLLEEGWGALTAALASRWRDESSRRAWVLAIFDDAARFLPRGHWSVHHPRSLGPADRDAVEDGMRGRAGSDLTWVEHSGLEAGVRVARGPVVVDGTPDGLLVQRLDTAARLLASYLVEREDDP